MKSGHKKNILLSSDTPASLQGFQVVPWPEKIHNSSVVFWVFLRFFACYCLCFYFGSSTLSDTFWHLPGQQWKYNALLGEIKVKWKKYKVLLLKTTRRRCTGGLKPPQMTPFAMEELCFYSELLSLRLSQAPPGSLYPGFPSSGYDPYLMTIDGLRSHETEIFYFWLSSNFTTTDRSYAFFTADEASVCQSISRSVLPSIINKTSR